MQVSKKIRDKLDTLPLTPGVYFHKNKEGKIIYVGKAAKLRQRVRQYFQESRTRDPKTEALVANIVDIDWVEVESEIDALFLEAELIKRYKPMYNIALRDDKSASYVRIDSRSDHPTVTTVKRPLDDNAHYFGPYLNDGAVRRALRLLRRVFPYDQKVPVNSRQSSRLNQQMGLSPGIETGKMELSEYRAILRKLMMYLKGERSQLLKQLEKEMQQAAKDQNFERAAVLRNQVYGLKELNNKIVFGDQEFVDITKDQALSGLMDVLDLSNPPRRIEGYDISHLHGTNNVASMVVFTNGLPDKTNYRKFKMRLKGNDDFAHMQEVISRRLSVKNIDAWGLPDLLLIDGGKGQVGAAQKAMHEAGLSIPMIGLAKRFETIIIPKEDGYEEVLLGLDSNVVKLLQRIRDESHRFAVNYQRTLRKIPRKKK